MEDVRMGEIYQKPKEELRWKPTKKKPKERRREVSKFPS
jgi:hypothetical protein